MSVQVHYIGLKSEIEALTGVISGATAIGWTIHPLVDRQAGTYNGSEWSWEVAASDSVTWGEITGNLAEQTDLYGEFQALDERIDDKLEYSVNGDALNSGIIPEDTVPYMEGGSLNGKNAQQIVDFLKPILDTLYEPKTP